MGDWLSHQHDLHSRNVDDEPLKLVETWGVDHVQVNKYRLDRSNSFSISESGIFGISCAENPSLSVMYPGTDKPPTVLSNQFHRSATFVKVSDKEYLSAACEENGCLYLWHIDSETSQKVFDPKLPSEQLRKGMNIFKINDNTVGYGEVYASPDGSRRVFIFKTDKEQLILSATLRLFTPDDIWDMCYTEVEGGTPCLLLCMPYAHRIMSVEMINGKTRSEVGKELMGEEFDPWSICTDQNDCAYVADKRQRMIHHLSASDGTVIKRFDCRNIDIRNVFAVRFHDQHLFVEKFQEGPSPKYAINKFIESNSL